MQDHLGASEEVIGCVKIAPEETLKMIENRRKLKQNIIVFNILRPQDSLHC